MDRKETSKNMELHLCKFSDLDGVKELSFIQDTDFYVKGFNIVRAFEGIDDVDSFRKKIRELNDLAAKDPTEKQFYWIIVNDEPVGIITLRAALSGFWLHNAGHIGIAIDKPFRGKGYGTKAFSKMCDIAENDFGIKDIVTMALVENVASRTMIEKCGGKYWDTITAADGCELARYWITRK